MKRARLRGSLAALTIGVMAVAGQAVAPSAGAEGPATAGPGDYDGGGTVNVIARSGSTFVAGGDTQGLYRSTNGTQWATANKGLNNANLKRVAALVATQFDGQTRWYAGVGNAPGSGGVLVSTDDGVSWTMMGGSPAFQGANTLGGAGVPDKHPRSVGNLLGVSTNATGSYLIAGSFNDGLFVCKLRTAATSCESGWTNIGLAGKYIRSIAMGGSADDRTVYAATCGDGVWRVEHATDAPGAPQKYSAGPTHAEELRVSNQILVSVGTDGVQAVPESAGLASAWSKPSPNLDVDTVYTSMDVRKAGSNVIVTMGICNAGSGVHACGIRRKGAGSFAVEEYTITPSGATVTIGGRTDRTATKSRTFPSGDTFWLEDGVQITGTDWIGGDFLVADGFLYAAGRGGIYRQPVNDPTAAWVPTHEGAPLMFSRRLAVRGFAADNVAVTDADWNLAEAGTGMSDPERSGAPTVQGGNAGIDVAWTEAMDGSQTSGLVVSTGGQESNTSGHIGVRAPGGAGFSGRPLPSGVTGRPTGLAGKHGFAAADKTAVVAWVQGSGLWLHDGTSWTKAPAAPAALNTAASGGNGIDLELVWAPGQQSGTDAVFVSVPGGGVWRYRWTSAAPFGTSADWDRIGSATGPTSLHIASKGVGSGFVLWIADDDTVLKANAPMAVTPSSPITVASVPAGAGKIAGLGAARSADRIAVVTAADVTSEPGFWIKSASGSDPLVNAMAGNEAYQGQGRFPADVALSGDGLRGYVATGGNGVVAVGNLP